MSWSYLEAPVMFQAGSEIRDFPDQKVIVRSDTHAPLSVVSRRYQVVQPVEVLEFYRDLVEVGGFELETAGVLKGGRKLWALAKTGQEATLRGGDRVKSYLLLATACDGTLATTAQFTSVRVVCNNTLQIALAIPRSGEGAALDEVRSRPGEARAGRRRLHVPGVHVPHAPALRAAGHSRRGREVRA